MSNEIGKITNETIGFPIDSEINQKIQKLHSATILYTIDIDKPELKIPKNDRESELIEHIRTTQSSPNATQVVSGYMTRIKTTLQECKDGKYSINQNNLIATAAKVLQQFHNLRLNSEGQKAA